MLSDHTHQTPCLLLRAHDLQHMRLNMQLHASASRVGIKKDGCNLNRAPHLDPPARGLNI